MYLFLVEAAFAQGAAGPPAIPELGQYPILQVFGGILSLIVAGAGAFFYLRGLRDNKDEPPPKPPIHFYADGAIAQFTRHLERIADALDRGLKFADDVGQLKKDWQSDIQETRHRLRNETQERMGSIDADIKTLEDRLRLLEIELATMKGERAPRR